MAVRFECPGCKANYEVADDLAGKVIMCRVCKKRGPVRSLAAAATAATTPLAASASAGAPMSRRNFLPIVGLFAASVGAIGVGALLARAPWERGKEEDNWRRRRPRDDDKKDKKDDKGNAV